MAYVPWAKRSVQQQYQHRSQMKRRRKQYKYVVQAIKEITPCADCGRKFPYFVMDFDHLDEDKKVRNGMLRSYRSFTKLAAEIDKCELVCSNCHRIRTFTRGQYRDNTMRNGTLYARKEAA